MRRDDYRRCRRPRGRNHRADRHGWDRDGGRKRDGRRGSWRCVGWSGGRTREANIVLDDANGFTDQGPELRVLAEELFDSSPERLGNGKQQVAVGLRGQDMVEAYFRGWLRAFLPFL